MANSRNTICEKNPYVSKSMGIHPKHVPAALKQIKREGKSFTFDGHGHVVATSAKGKKDAMDYFGVGNRDAGYGDVCP